MKGTAAGAASGVASGAMKYMKNPNGYCFVAGTIVATVLGFAAIETIQAGDYVLAKDVDTGIVSYEPVLQTFVREVDETYTITIDGEEIETTAEHPFYVENEGFVQAQDLEAGDNVETADGESAEVESVKKNEHDEPVIIYNFEVMDDHTYYVGENSLLVHNTGSCGGDVPDAIDSGSKTVEVNGKRVTLDNNTFDPNLVDKQGRTNIQRMEQGLSPIGTDGKSVNVHHIDQTNNGPVMEITATNHQQNYSKLHTNIGQSPSQIDRSAFNRWRNAYWKWRGKNLE